MPEPLAYLNGEFLPQSQLAVPYWDAGFVFGATVTDLIRTFHFRSFRLADHLARFRQSCILTSIPQPLPDEELTRIAEHLLAHNTGLLTKGQELALVLFATPGPVPHYAGSEAAGERRPTLGMHTFPLPFVRYAPYVREGIRLVVPSVRQVPAECIDPRVKQRSRLHWWLAEQEAQRIDPGAIALLLDRDGRVTETASSNLVVVRNGTVFTPPRASVLGGVSLRVVEELCAELGLPFQERPLTPNDLFGADEVLLTCTSYCLAGVSRVNGVPVPWPGGTLRRLLAAWNARVGLDIHGQILHPEP